MRVTEAATRGVDAIPALSAALGDESPLVQRAAVRELALLGPAANDALEAALDAEDVLVRRAALLALTREASPAALPHLARAIRDPDPALREIAVRLLLAVEPRNSAVLDLLGHAAADESPRIQRLASEALSPFRVDPRETVLLRERPEIMDHIERVVTVLEKPLPSDGWQFRFDRGVVGHLEKWFQPEIDEQGWDPGEIERAWEAGYVGVGWYRLTVALPERPEHLAAELRFEGVDESAWVWVNGTYVGGQDIGPGGWNRPFRVDCTQELRWGGENVIAVRVMNTTGGGGIWRPVVLDVLGMRR